MRYINKIVFLILLFNYSINPIFSSSNRNSFYKNKKGIITNKIHKDLKIANNSKSENKTFILKEIPKFSIEKIKKNVKSDKDPIRDTSQYNYDNGSFDNLNIELLGLFKVNKEINAMFRTNDGIKNYLIGDKLFDEFEIKDINLLSEEVEITDGKKSRIYKFPNK